MKKIICSLIVVAVIASGLALADDPLPRYSLGGEMIHGGSADQAKAATDTINLMSSHLDPTNGPGEPLYYGDFENAVGAADWHGWTSIDNTQPVISHWQVSNYRQADPANLTAWCGDITIPSCEDSLDPAGGYGNSWHDQLEFRVAVLDNGIPATVNVTATLENDTEPGYDFTRLSYQYAGQATADLASWDGAGTIAVNGSVTYLPAELLDGSDIRLLFRFKSDGGWSDADCFWPTAGAARVDDITVTVSQAGYADQVFFEDFQGGDLNLGDGLGDPGSYLWSVSLPLGVGDFAKIWEGLQDVDPCNFNFSPQVAFIDDGIVVPGTGGTDCINWCYGPQGYIVNTTGGLAGPAEHIDNAILSPVMAWPEPTYDGTLFSFGIFRHEDLSNDAPGIFYTWGVRSADVDGDGGNGVQAIEDQPWLDRNFVYWGGPDYFRAGADVTNLMNPGRDEAQIQLVCYELGWVWGWVGNDGYPAPYFDNVKFQVFEQSGPGMSAREIDLANDGFPERGDIDFQDLGSLHVRFDMARNISLPTHQNVDFGDSLVVDIRAVRVGASLYGTPELRYLMVRNPVFDPYRSAGLPAQGAVPGRPIASEKVIITYYAFDLPDTGFLFPGDELHYYIYAEDAIGGADIRGAILPADTTGFSDGFGDPLAYNSTFTVRALPTIREDGFGGYETPPIIFWNDFGNRGGENEWYFAFKNAAKQLGTDYDIYYTNGPSSGVGNGLGGRAKSPLMLEHYTDLFYTAGDLGVNTISNGDFNNDSGDDVDVLTGWFMQGGKDMFLTGDDLASDLAINGGAATLAFAEDIMGVGFQQQDLRSFIENQATPMVRALPGNPVIQNVLTWVAFGGCPGYNTFDGVVPTGTGQRLAEFLDPAGAGGAYPFSAATLNIPQIPGTSRVVSLPYDLMYVYTNDDAPVPPLSARSQILRDVIAYFGIPISGGEATPVVPGLEFAARNYPNPFNPATKIVYTVPRAGHLSLKVYDIRGMLVKTLVDDRVEAGADQVAVWDGTDQAGSAVSSGVYFYEARAAGEVKVGKMALLK